MGRNIFACMKTNFFPLRNSFYTKLEEVFVFPDFSLIFVVNVKATIFKERTSPWAYITNNGLVTECDEIDQNIMNVLKKEVETAVFNIDIKAAITKFLKVQKMNHISIFHIRIVQKYTFKLLLIHLEKIVTLFS